MMMNSFRFVTFMACISFVLANAPVVSAAPATETPVTTTQAEKPATTQPSESTPPTDGNKAACDKASAKSCKKNCDKPCCKTDKKACDKGQAQTCDKKTKGCCKTNVKNDDKDQKATAKAASPTTQPTTPTTQATTKPTSKKPSALARMEEQTKQLSAQAALRSQLQKAKFSKLNEENMQLKLEYSLLKQRQTNALIKLDLERQRLAAMASLRKAQQQEALSKLQGEIATLNANMQLKETQDKQKLLQMKSELGQLTTERSLAKAKVAQQIASMEDERAVLASKNAIASEKFRATQLELSQQSTLKKSSFIDAQTDIQLRQLTHKKDEELSGKPPYRKEPLVDGTLYISDRRIKLTGPIITGTADYICDRIHFYNNESSEKPIFLVIDNCPGGSVMQGYRIVKAIQSSTAPIHVVVKSFAASMAAIITTLADHSYAYPNAIILHHQLSAGVQGNVTDMAQAVRSMKEWERRLAEPVAKKMGITIAEFKEQMYAHRATGDWDEFADNAVKLKWVDHIVNEIREEGTRKRPVGDPPKPWYWAFFSQDQKGNTYCKLPPLEPMDAYFIYNPNNFFRMQ